MSEKRGKGSPLFLDSEKVKKILKKGSDSLMLSASEEEINRAAELIDSMKDDLFKIFSMPLNNNEAENFHSHESFTLEEIDKFYSEYSKKESKNKKDF